MAEFPVLPLWTDALKSDTDHLTTLEFGAYMKLLITAWRSRDCRLPDDDDRLARYARLTRAQWQRIKPVLLDFFDVRDGFWTQGRLTDEYVHVRQVRESQAANGRASALKRKGRHATKREPSVNQSATPSPSPSPTVESPSGDSPSCDGPALRPEHVFEGYQALASELGISVPRDFTPERRQLVRGRITQYTLDDFQTVFGKCRDSPFLRGDVKGRTPLAFDWLMKKGNFQKVLEGNYDR